MIKVNIGGIDVDCFNNLLEATEYILENCLSTATVAVAINPEKIMMYRQSSEIAKIIDSANLRYLDGMGAAFAASKKLNKKVNRIPGCELWESLMIRSTAHKSPVYLIGSSKEVLAATVNKLGKLGVNIVGSHDGYYKNESDVINDIIFKSPKILCVALGSPRQEVFMLKCKEQGVNCFMMGVGGTFDVYTGSVTRAPDFFCNLNLEWLYRLLSQPSRIFRQMNLIKYLILYLRNKL